MLVTLRLPELTHPLLLNLWAALSEGHTLLAEFVLGMLLDVHHLVAEGLDHFLNVLLAQPDGEPARVAGAFLIDALAHSIKVLLDLNVEGDVADHPRIHEDVCKEPSSLLQLCLIALAETSDRPVLPI